MIKIILLCVIGLNVYLALGTIATIEHFERMGLNGGWLVLFWPVVYLGIALAMAMLFVEDTMKKLLGLYREIWRRIKK